MANRLASENAADSGDVNPRAVMGDNMPPAPTPVEAFSTSLLENYSAELAKAGPIADRANNSPEKIESDADLKAWTDIYLEADTLAKALDASRLNEQRPMVAVLKTVFGPTLDRLERITTHARKLSDAYNRVKVQREREQREAEQRKAQGAARQAEQDARIAAEFGDTNAMLEHAQTATANAAEAARVATDTPTVSDIARVRGDDGGMATARGEWKAEILDINKIDLNALRHHFTIKEITRVVDKEVRTKKQHAKIEGVRVFEDVATQFRR
ncbi:MAG: hypothetical protein WA418_04375 [Bradyrhizobium sp.]